MLLLLLLLLLVGLSEEVEELISSTIRTPPLCSGTSRVYSILWVI